MTVEEMLDRMSSLEISEWIAFIRNHPIGERRADMRMARICWVVASSAGAKVKEQDFLLFPDDSPQSEEDMILMTKLIDQLVTDEASGN